MTLSNDLWSESIELANSSYLSRFIVGIKNGDLPLENFKNYIAQDAFFLESFARAYGMAISKTKDKNSLSILTNLLNGVIKELELHDSYSTKLGIGLYENTINPATKAYTDFLYQTSISGEMIEIISAMTPCMRLYAWIGNKVNKENLNKNNPYQEWITTYSDISFEELAKTLEDLIDIYHQKENIQKIHFLYRQAMQMELAFFEAYSP